MPTRSARRWRCAWRLSGSAKVWVSIMGTEVEREKTMKALTDAAPWMRRQLGDRLTIRHIPQLLIRHDDSIEAGDRVLRLLRELEDEGRQ